jgi:magnesium transporter
MTFAAPVTSQFDLRARLKEGGLDQVVASLLTCHPVEIVEALESHRADEQLAIYQRLPDGVAAQVLANADTEFRAQILSQLEPERLARILDRLLVDKAADLLDEVPEARAARILEQMTPGVAEQLRALRCYPPSAVGHLMLRSFPRVTPEMTVAAALEHLRAAHPQLETMSNLYVVDAEQRLLGVVSLRELVLADPGERLGQRMQRRVVAVTADTDREEAANLISRYRFLALPVVDMDRQLLGIVTIDDLVDVLIEENTEDVMRLGAVSGGADQPSYWAGRILTAVRGRASWLLLLFLAGTLTATVLDHFSLLLRGEVALAFFIPLLIGTGGNAGSQAVMTVVRGLALGEIRGRDAARVLRREAITGALLGLCLGIIAFSWVTLRLGRPDLAAVVGLTALAVCVWANTVGCLVPILAHRLRIDPTVVSAPFITTLVDATGLVIYFVVARAVLGL